MITFHRVRCGHWDDWYEVDSVRATIRRIRPGQVDLIYRFPMDDPMQLQHRIAVFGPLYRCAERGDLAALAFVKAFQKMVGLPE